MNCLRKHSIRGLFASTAVVAVASLSLAFADEQQTEIDPAAETILRSMAKHYEGLQHFSVDTTYEMASDSDNDETGEYSDRRRVVVARPNRLSVAPIGDGEGTVKCDGKQLLAYLPSAGHYLLEDAPADFSALLQGEATFLMGAGRTALQLVAGNADEQFTASATKVVALDPQQIDGVDCDGIELTQEHATIVLWIEQGDRPWVRQMEWEMQFETEGTEGEEFDIPRQVMKLANWSAEPPEKDEFAINVPDNAEHVASLFMSEEEETESGPHPLLGLEAPEVEFPLLGGGSQDLAKLKGNKVVVLDFWAEWCGPCVEALPGLEQVSKDFGGRDVAFYAVNLGDAEADIEQFRKRHELDLPIGMDADGKIAQRFHTNNIPMTVIIDKQGVIQVVHEGLDADLETTITEEIEDVLAGKQLAAAVLEAEREARRNGIAIPAGSDAMIAKDLSTDVLAFNRRTLVDAYEEFGSKNEEWDNEAKAFLAEVVKHFSRAEGFKLQAELAEIAAPLIEKGCDDPLVHYCYGSMLQDANEDPASVAEGARLIEESYDGLVARDYPANRCFASARRIWQRAKSDEDEPKANRYRGLAINHAVEMVLQDDTTSNEGRTLCSHLVEFAEQLPLDARAAMYEQAKPYEEQSPYAVNVLGGEYHVKAAWAARGTGWASEVTEEGWQGFADHIKQSRECFQKAWVAAPTRPEPATSMIVVAMTSDEGMPNEMRMWFDRAVEAQLDHSKAYYNLLNGMMPRWGGTHEQMYEFGLECAATDRYDTDVPYILCDAVWRIVKDDHNALGARYLQQPGVYENVRKVCKQYIERSDRGESYRDWWKTVWLAFAYHAERWDEAKPLLEELESNLDADALGRFPLNADEVEIAVRFHSSPHSEAIQAAFDAASDGDRDEAIARLKELVDERQLHPLVENRVRSRLTGLQHEMAFAGGKPLDLSTAQGLDGWAVIAGNWNRKEDGAVSGVSDKSGVVLQSVADFGTHWELTGTVSHGNSPYNPWDAGVLLYRDDRPYYTIMFNPTKNWVAAGPYKAMDDHKVSYEGGGKETSFAIRVAGDVVDVWLGDDHLIKHQSQPGLSRLAPYRIALGAKYSWDGSELTFSDLKIERVPEAE